MHIMSHVARVRALFPYENAEKMSSSSLKMEGQGLPPSGIVAKGPKLFQKRRPVVKSGNSSSNSKRNLKFDSNSNSTALSSQEFEVGVGAGPTAPWSKTSSNVAPMDEKLAAEDTTHRCPVCGRGLVDDDAGFSLRANYLKYKRDAEFVRKKLEYGWEGRMAHRADEDAIVAASCGELFHKQCLLKYVHSMSMQGSSFSNGLIRAQTKKFSSNPHQPLIRRSRVACPRCENPLVMSVHQEIDLDGHRGRGLGKGGCSSLLERQFNETRLTNQELSFHHEKKSKRLKELEDALESAREKLAAAQEQRQKLSAKLPESKALLQRDLDAMRARKREKAWIENYIERAERVIEFMEQETPKTMRLYLDEVHTRPLDEIPKTTPIPRMLIPYLHQISEDDYCLFALSQIIEPRPYPGSKFDLDDLLLGILRKVAPGLKEQLAKQMEKSGASLLVCYNALFPDTCLQMLASCRELRERESEQFKLPQNQFAITIMYMVDEDEGDEAESKIMSLSSQHFLADKASNFVLSGDSVISFEGEDDLKSPPTPGSSKGMPKFEFSVPSPLFQIQIQSSRSFPSSGRTVVLGPAHSHAKGASSLPMIDSPKITEVVEIDDNLQQIEQVK